MQDFLKNSYSHVSGIQAIWFVPIRDVILIPDVANYSVIKKIILQQNSFWYRAEITVETGGLKIISSKTQNGPVFKCSASAIVVGDSEDMNKLAGEMDFHSYLIIIVDNENNRRLLGTQDNASVIGIDFEIPMKVSGRKSYQFTFSYSSGKRPPYYKYNFVNTPNEDLPQTGIDFMKIESADPTNIFKTS